MNREQPNPHIAGAPLDPFAHRPAYRFLANVPELWAPGQLYRDLLAEGTASSSAIRVKVKVRAR